LVIDTANFQHPNTTPRTLRVAAELVAAGAPLYDTARRLYRTKPNRKLQLFGRVMADMDTDLDGRLVWATLTDADLAAAGALDDGRRGISDLLSQSETGEVVILFKEAKGRRGCRSGHVKAASTRRS
jgi:phosphoesterase RecJ-like protein